MFKYIIGVAVALGVAFAAYGAAASLDVNGNAVQYGEDNTLKCTQNVAIWWTTTTGPGGVEYITNVALGGMNSDCNGMEAKVVLTDGTPNPVYVSGYKTISGGSAGFPLTIADDVTVLEVTDVHVTVVQQN